MRDIDVLAQSPRTPTSAFVVSMWYIPGGCDYQNATTVTGFFEAEEEDDARQMAVRNANTPEMAILNTIEQHDVAVHNTLRILDRKVETYADFEPAIAQKARLDAAALRATNLM
jgi:hypothetical protein